MISESSPFPWFSTARRHTRRIVVAAYWALALGLLILYLCALLRGKDGLFGIGLLIPLQILVFLPAILGGVRIGGIVKPFNGVRWVGLDNSDQMQTLLGPRRYLSGEFSAADANLDERDLRDRDRVHFFAYTAARWLAFILLTVQLVIVPAWLLYTGNAAFVLLTLVLWSLPQSMILWTEPDMETPR